ncbi:MAG TPA: helix-turn-helix domain-containing protein [Rectinemataceae bacterium]|nr:helix-turn-helix domain-containing protein [Rectinemataceae bacterium]
MLKAIVIEDEPAPRRELVLLTPWEELGMVCAGEAADGLEGLELTGRVSPDIIILDIRMPGMDGLAFIEELFRRSASTESSFPEIIVLSGYSEFEYARAAMRHGVDEYLLKPVEDKVLKAALLRKKEKIRANSAQNQAQKPFFSEYERKDAGEEHDGYVDAAVKLIRERYIQGVSIEEAAQELGVSSGHLSRLFRRETGYTFVDYLVHIRVKMAMRLLRDPTVRVYEVADLVGYEDTRYFAQVFKKVSGMTPREFKDGIANMPQPSGTEFQAAFLPTRRSDSR